MFFHLGPAASPVTDTDIGPLLSAPHSRTGSWPWHNSERLMEKEANHILTQVCATRGFKEEQFISLPHIHTYTHIHLFYPLTNLLEQCHSSAFSDICQLDPGCSQENNTSTAIIRFLWWAVAVCSHLGSKLPPSGPLIISYTESLIIHLHRIVVAGYGLFPVDSHREDQDPPK